ncbi:hypothetical protein KO473_21215 [Bacteroides sp. HF-4919]|jgi:hypothetical protein|uniref:hypothetical protein n=1 Tax=Bacteroides sp. HF-4919 TaxID=2841744 RepID=UPI001C085904|nr:hypothetical protein [Bacteroides sp. HF-4919]MBU3043456.1 hypothetical protein [Bacteroides sp. HF-4919]
MMKKESKENLQLFSAVGMLMVGTGLAIAGFLADPVGEIHDSVLWIFAQCLIYAGSIFGVGIYINGKFNHLQNKLLNKEEQK